VTDSDTREAVLSNAKYLRGVRPVDPEEVSEYVEGGAHPAVVRQVLREEAFALGFVERDDGTFVPVGEAPVAPGGTPIGALPRRYERVVEDRLVARFGREWYRGEDGDTLRTVVRRLKSDYYAGRTTAYDATAVLAYAVYHLADYYAAVGYLLEELAESSLLPRRLRVVDVGAGVGGPALGLFDYLDDAERHDRTPGPALVDYHAVEPSAAADLLDRLLAETPQNVRTTVHRDTAEAFDPATALPDEGGSEGAIDLLLFSNVVSELDDPVAVVDRYLDHLAGDGSLVLLAPADRETSLGLRRVERAVADRAPVFSPTVRLWPDRSPEGECWSFVDRPPVEAPGIQKRLQQAAPDANHGREFLKTAVRSSYAIHRFDGRRRVDVTPDANRFTPMADNEDHVTDRMDLIGVKLSGDLTRTDPTGDRRRGKNDRDHNDRANPLYLVGDGSETTAHFAVLVNETGLNEGLRRSGYGDLLTLSSVLVLWNDDEAAYNLVVDEETVVEVFSAPV
jgi:SAM-dependent methyltransferase